MVERSYLDRNKIVLTITIRYDPIHKIAGPYPTMQHARLKKCSFSVARAGDRHKSQKFISTVDACGANEVRSTFVGFYLASLGPRLKADEVQPKFQSGFGSNATRMVQILPPLRQV